MIVAGAFFFQINTGTNGVDAFPEGSITRDAFFILEEEFAFGFGVVNPAEVVISGEPEILGSGKASRISHLLWWQTCDFRFPQY